VSRSTSELLPEVRNGCALEEEEEEEEYAVDFYDDERTPQDQPVRTFHCDSKQKDADAQL
jgi:hypothetical protein